ncbi:MAG: ankyrin repeat domain-containing protein [Gammaproteobacteria bacterium]|nr:ankyrin repeat domain-containing protein [Gammaproteobacteria bacterium]
MTPRNRNPELIVTLALSVLIFSASPSAPAKRIDTYPLHAAAQSNDTERLRTLLSRDAPASQVRLEFINQRDIHGRTALLYAVRNQNANAIQALLAAGASPNIADNAGTTPLHLALTAPRDILQALLSAGANIYSLDYSGCSALMRATAEERPDLINLLRAAVTPAGAHPDKQVHTKHAAQRCVIIPGKQNRQKP